jgi:hypothetical protein
VCEGEKTEPNYFEDLRHDLRLASANVIVTGDSDPDPRSVVAFGLEEYHQDGDYDRLYCVFDRDTHSKQNFDAAIQRLRRARRDGVDAHWTVSYPCFEYWILLHYESSARRYTHPDSPCNQVMDDVQDHLPNYGKGMHGLFEETKPRLDEAIERSRRRWREAKNSRSLNPSTKVHKLVIYLQNIRS